MQIPEICQNLSELLSSLQYDSYIESKYENQLVTDIPALIQERLGKKKADGGSRFKLNKMKVFDMLRKGHEEQRDLKFIRLV